MKCHNNNYYNRNKKLIQSTLVRLIIRLLIIIMNKDNINMISKVILNFTYAFR